MSKTPENELIASRHPEYNSRESHWDFLEMCYEGGRDWFDDNIFQYVKEGDAEYKQRVERAYRFNHSREVVDLVNKYLFRATISRNLEDCGDTVKRFWNSATKNGMGIDNFISRCSKLSSIFGRIYIVMDTNMVSGAVSVADVKKQKFRNYAYVVKPQDALNMSFDEVGKLNWILLRETYREDTNPFDIDDNVYERWRLWTKTEWVLFQVEDHTAKKDEILVVEVDRGVHGLNEVPVIVHDHIEDDNLYYTPALINDIAYLDRATANYLSNLDAIIQDQTFSQLAMPAQAIMPGEEKNLREKLIELGTKRIFIYNGEGGVEPKFLSPDPRQAELIITAIQTIINEIYHTVGMAGERTKQDNSMGIDNSSGVAKAFDFDRVNALLSAKAKSLNTLEWKLIRLVKLWNGEKLEDEDEETRGLVKYASDFDIRGLIDEFDIASRLALISAPDEVRRAQMETLVEKLFPAITVELKKKIAEGLKDWPPDPMEMDALSGSKPAEPAAKGPTQGAVQPDDESGQ